MRRRAAGRPRSHAHLVNLGSPTHATVERSHASIAHSLRRAAAIGAIAVVIHAGSAVTALGVCLDTCHAFAAGMTLATPAAMTAPLD